MRRQFAVLVLCVLFGFAGCTGGGLGVKSSTPTEEAPPTETDVSTVHTPEGTLEIHAINVGQADATLVRTDEETMLVDSGHWQDDGETVIAYLEAHGVDRIDHLVSTHAHADHIGGHEAIIDYYETEKGGVGAVYDPGVPHTTRTYERYLDAIERHDVDLFEIAEGDELPFEGAGATVLNPAEPGGDDLHDGGVALRVALGETSFLFTGDAERDAEARMLEAHGDALDADVYQAGHHGSDTSSGPAFLDAVDPEVAVVSSGYDSQYGHPHDEPLERFAERGIETTWTAVHGTIVFESDGRELSVRTQHDATTDPLALRDEPEATADPADPAEERFVIRGGDDTSERQPGGDPGNGRLAPPTAGAGSASVGTDPESAETAPESAETAPESAETAPESAETAPGVLARP
jgi:competence protein ComEC